MQIAVRNQQKIVLRMRQHVDEIGDLAVAAMLRGIDHQPDVALRKAPLQPPHHGDRGIGMVLHAEHDLEVRIILPADARQRLLQQRLVAIQRLQQRHWRRGEPPPHARSPPQNAAPSAARRSPAPMPATASPAAASDNTATASTYTRRSRRSGWPPCRAGSRSAAWRPRGPARSENPTAVTATRLIVPSSRMSTTCQPPSTSRIT